MARIDPDLIVEALGFFALLFKKKMRKKLQKLAATVAVLNNLLEEQRTLERRIYTAAQEGKGMQLSPDEVTMMQITYDTVRAAADEVKELF